VLKFGRMITFSLLFGAIIWLGNNIEIIIWLDEDLLLILGYIRLDDTLISLFSFGWMTLFYFSFGVNIWLDDNILDFFEGYLIGWQYRCKHLAKW
jgi:hypothetical protein